MLTYFDENQTLQDPVGNRIIWNIMIQTQFSLIGYLLDSMKFQKPFELFLDLKKKKSHELT